jgi:hypothetical protein
LEEREAGRGDEAFLTERECCKKRKIKNKDTEEASNEKEFLVCKRQPETKKCHLLSYYQISLTKKDQVLF